MANGTYGQLVLMLTRILNPLQGDDLKPAIATALVTDQLQPINRMIRNGYDPFPTIDKLALTDLSYHL